MKILSFIVPAAPAAKRNRILSSSTPDFPITGLFLTSEASNAVDRVEVSRRNAGGRERARQKGFGNIKTLLKLGVLH